MNEKNKMEENTGICVVILLIFIFVTLTFNAAFVIRNQEKLIVIAEAQKEAQIQTLFELRKISQGVCQ